MEIVQSVLALGGLGLIFGALLGIAAKFFSVETDIRVEKIASLLPGANCGGCGFAGCAAMAEALAEGKAMPSGCAVLKDEERGAILEMMGLEGEQTVKRVAKVLCGGNLDVVNEKCNYDGILDCRAANRYAGGSKACLYGCLGYGTCVSACRFDALSMENGVAKVSADKCTACGSCVAVCPRNIISLVPADQRAHVLCRSKERGAVQKEACRTGCIGCKICEKVCPKQAISVKDNLAVINYELCSNCGLCAEKCPQKIIEIKGE
ncbi:MAG: 4Fe-4S dicluster domain-containing protein [Ruminococcaceae bacterium]|nr:4Fe-4S dicluster domain-containing protein [Oscillospiraceae bacterium]